MATLDPPVGSHRLYRRALLSLILAAFFGLLSFAAVREARIDCQDEYLAAGPGQPLMTDDGHYLATGRQRCSMDLGNTLQIPLPMWAQSIIGR